MAMNIGIIGAENSHATAYSKMMNVDKLFEGFAVTHIWGETRDFAEKAAAAGQIPNITDESVDMLGKVDAIIVDHRHAKYHLDAARPFVDAGVPTFVDKPFCYRSKKGREFLAAARDKGTPVTSFSSLSFQASFKAFQKEIEDTGGLLSGGSYGSGNLDNEYGGVFFYGVHQVEMLLHAFGWDVEAALASIGNGGLTTASLMYPSGFVATMSLVSENSPGFGMDAVGRKGAVHSPIRMDKVPYLESTKAFLHMFETGEEPLTNEQLLKPVQVLEAIEKSITSGTVEKLSA